MNSAAVALPMPLAAPVMTATLPANLWWELAAVENPPAIRLSGEVDVIVVILGPTTLFVSLYVYEYAVRSHVRIRIRGTSSLIPWP
ncbi:Os07g0663850 [Oryza sativa Japonica Group]|uniref:Os07g0663850 protein n=1 Tax=Oryza sativa subsp. japonica TaxID=39947 RepID=A0A0P0XA08_ORYSJ|nr:Os07g0663850 [Oryza sativa Japonica Group]